VRRLERAAIGLALASAAGCGGTPPPARSDAGPSFAVASSAAPPLFEGMGAAVTFLTAPGTDFRDATVEAEAGLVVLGQRCVEAGCAVVLEVPDTEPDRGMPLPPAIDAENRFLIVRRPAGSALRAAVSVVPLDAIRNGGDTATVRGVFLASSLESTPETIFRGAPGREPPRWFVFGSASLLGTVDVAARADEPGPGGLRGAASGPATGAGAGGAGSSAGGAGGGGSAARGEAGQGMGAGEGGAAFGVGCALDGFAEECGGGGGGAAEGPGGAGAGAFALVALGGLEVDVDVLATGADGAAGGGGGGGGRVAVVSRDRIGAGVRANVAGGAGGGRAEGGGGAGAVGEANLDPTVTVEAYGPWITDEPTFTVRGTADDGTEIRVEDLAGTTLAAISASSGVFEVPVPLVPGLNRLRVIGRDTSGEHRSWQGNHLEFERRGTLALPVGALLDVVRLP